MLYVAVFNESAVPNPAGAEKRQTVRNRTSVAAGKVVEGRTRCSVETQARNRSAKRSGAAPRMAQRR